MATKLRRFRYHKVTKVVAFLVIVVSFTMAMLQLDLLLQKKLDPECLIEPDYHMSTDFYYQLDDALRMVSLIEYKEEALEEVPFYYYIKVASKTYTNSDRSDQPYFEKFDRAFFYMEDGEWKSGIHSYDKRKLGHGLLYDHTAYVAFPNDYLDEKQTIWTGNRNELLPNAIICLISLFLSLSITIFSCIITGREQEDKAIHLRNRDRSYTELLLIPLVLIVWFYTTDMLYILSDSTVSSKVNPYKWDIIKQMTATSITRTIFITVVSMLFSTIVLLLLHSLIRKWKARILLRDCILRIFIHRLYQLYRYLFYGDIFHTESFVKNLHFRQMVFLTGTIISSSLIAVFVYYGQRWFLIPLALEIIVIVWYTKGNNSIYDKISKEIRDTTEEQMKSERMKVELITNVSHDLKTPLTSIISFIDLLSKENNLSEGAKDYIKILQDKSEKLKNIVLDLFDLAKSTSGDVKLEYDYIDLGKLITQTLVDMDDRIENSGLSFKCKIPEAPIYIYADGNKIYRVFLNLIDNSLKYTMRQTRVYIELSCTDNKAEVSIKNIAGYDMNFTANEMLQRFARGDQSRTSEGSGLGLSIAESFTRVCGGDLRVELEGDMFKIYLIFDRVENQKQEQSIVSDSQD